MRGCGWWVKIVDIDQSCGTEPPIYANFTVRPPALTTASATVLSNASISVASSAIEAPDE
jgi:hypothetical protein